MRAWIINLPRNVKCVFAGAADVMLIAATLWLSYCLRLEQFYLPDARVSTAIGLTTLITVFVFVRLGLYRAVIRFAGNQVLITVAVGITISALVFTTLAFLLQAYLPRSAPIIYLPLGIFAVAGSRLLTRVILNRESYHGNERVIIYGAGLAGRQLASTLAQGIEYQPVAFLDDDPAKQGTIIQGLSVHKPRFLPQLISDRKAHKIFLAIARLTSSERARIVSYLEQFDIKVQTIPGIVDILSGRARIDEVRNIEVQDLLGRDSVQPNTQLLAKSVTNKVVMVVGAGGTIGGELCRQIIELNPKMLILLEASEFALYNIEQELNETLASSCRDDQPRFKCILGDAQDRQHVRQVMKSFNVQSVYHTAAYKHVPMVEQNQVVGVRNNVLGTLHTAQAAMDAGVETFTLISTDKAVRPTNVMGATKRLAELIIKHLAATMDVKTRFSIVRFGNVLDSSGSVVPRFRRQIKNGGPITVTHPEVSRYFMTISEAVQLVIQASAMGKGGEVFVLNMGEPVKILKLAQTMIRLMDKRVKSAEDPDGDIEIKYIGLRPGEKLHEELLIADNFVGTEHSMIIQAIEDKPARQHIEGYLRELEQACDAYDCARIIEVLKKAVDNYTNTEEIFDEVHRHNANKGAKVTDLFGRS